MIKNASNLFSWQINDSARSPSNLVSLSVYADLNAAENSIYAAIDFTANGFKVRTTDGAQNTNGNTYIYAAFAENPFKFSLAR